MCLWQTVGKSSFLSLKAFRRLGCGEVRKQNDTNLINRNETNLINESVKFQFVRQILKFLIIILQLVLMIPNDS